MSVRFQHPVLTHPTTLFVAAWMMAISLAVWGDVPPFSEYSSQVVSIGCLIIIANVVGAVLPLFRLISGVRIGGSAGEINFLGRRAFFIGWALVSMFEIGVARGLPVVWLFDGSGRTYEHFGVPTLHGLANAVWLFLVFSQFVRVVNDGVRLRSVLIFAFLLSWPVLVISRALITIFFVQAVLYCVMVSRASVLRIVVLVVSFLTVFSLGFGFAGDVRAPEFSIGDALGVDEVGSVPSGFIWVYAYVVAPVSNLAMNIDAFQSLDTIFPRNSLAPLLPSVVRQYIGIETGFDGYLGELVHDAFNVGTAFLAPYFDWGMSGVLLLSGGIGFVGTRIWLSARDVRCVPLLSAYGTCAVLTIFTNQFNQLTPLLYMFMLFLLTKSERVESGSACLKET